MAQAVATYTGLTNIISAQMTFSRGIAPGVCSIRVPVENVYSIGNGDLWLTYGSQSVIFQDCALVRFHVNVSSGGNIAELQVVDRRWKWQFGNIRGAYNVKDRDGQITAGTEKTPLELVALLLDAMEESDYDTSRLDATRNELRPEVEWKDDNPARLLSELCDELSLVIVLNYETNHVELWPLGEGTDITLDSTAISPSVAVSGDLVPSSIRVVGGPTVWQMRFMTEAVGLDIDQQVKVLADLSYRPAEPNTIFELSMSNVPDDKARALARQSVYRWYRIYRFRGNDTQHLPGRPDLDITACRFIAETLKRDAAGQPIPAQLFGTYANRSGFGGNVLSAYFDDEFQIVENVVKLKDPAYHFVNGTQHSPAILDFDGACHAIDPDTHMTVRRTYDYVPPDAPESDTPPLIVHRDNLQHTYTVIYDVHNAQTGLSDSATEFDAAAQKVAEETWNKLRNRTGKDIAYEGVREYKLDGLVAQISWVVGGGTAAITRVSTHVEHSTALPTEAQRKRQQRLDLLAARRTKDRELIFGRDRI
jgi:hypothetical protein